MKKYPKYRKTDIAWLNEIPSHWEIVNLRTLLTPVSEKGRTDLQLLSVVREQGIIIRDLEDEESNHNIVPDDLSSYKVVHVNQFVMNKMKAWQGSYGISTFEGIVSPAYFTFNIQFNNLKYFHTAIRSKAYVNFFAQASDGIRVGQWDLSMDKMKNIPFFVPPRSEQDQIVRYLDWQVSKINKLINAKKKEIELLKELATRIINDLLLRGCRKNITLIDSGSNWMGNIPEHWKKSKICNHFVIKKRIAGKEGFPVLSVTQKGLKVKDIKSNEGQIAANYSNYQFVYPGEYAMNHMDLLTGYIGIASQLGVTSPDYRVFVLEDCQNCNPQYFLHLFELCYKRKIFYGYGHGAASQGRWRLPANNFLSFEIPLPPLSEQNKIVDKISKVANQIEFVTNSYEQQITHLQELRTRLISDVVTGQIDIRHINVPEFEMVEDSCNNKSIEEDTEEECNTENVTE